MSRLCTVALCASTWLLVLLWTAAAQAQTVADKPAAAAASAGKVPDTLAQRVLACALCHGANGEGQKLNEYHPRLATRTPACASP